MSSTVTIPAPLTAAWTSASASLIARRPWGTNVIRSSFFSKVHSIAAPLEIERSARQSCPSSSAGGPWRAVPREVVGRGAGHEARPEHGLRRERRVLRRGRSAWRREGHPTERSRAQQVRTCTRRHAGCSRRSSPVAIEGHHLRRTARMLGDGLPEEGLGQRTSPRVRSERLQRATESDAPRAP